MAVVSVSMTAKKRIGLLCLVVGGLAWPIGYAAGFDAPHILPIHLAFIFSGLGLRGSHLLDLIRRRRAG